MRRPPARCDVSRLQQRQDISIVTPSSDSDGTCWADEEVHLLRRPAIASFRWLKVTPVSCPGRSLPLALPYFSVKERISRDSPKHGHEDDETAGECKADVRRTAQWPPQIDLDATVARREDHCAPRTLSQSMKRPIMISGQSRENIYMSNPLPVKLRCMPFVLSPSGRTTTN